MGGYTLPFGGSEMRPALPGVGGSDVPQFNFGTGGTGSFSTGGSNQYMNYPSMTPSGANFGYGGTGTFSSGSNPTTTTGYPPGTVPPSSFPFQSGQNPAGLPSNWFNPNNVWGAGQGGKLPGGVNEERTLDPSLTASFNQYLMNMIGQGASPYNLSSVLPSTGQATTPGQLTAPLTPTMQNLQDFLMGKSAGVSGVPGTSGPLSYVLPMWQSEVSAMNQPIQQQLANIKEQFGSMGALGSTEMATALANYGEQTALGEQSLLGQLTMQALPQYGQQAQMFQGLDQQAIQNMYNEFIRTRPEYSPLLQEQYGMSTTFPPMYSPKGGIGSALLGAAPGLISDLAGGAGAGLAAAGGGAGLAGSIIAGLAAI